MDERRLKGLVNAPEFPQGLSWLNTTYPLRLSDFKGKVVLLDFWTFGCINCHHVIGELKQLEQEFADYLVIIGVHSGKFPAEKNTDHIRTAVLQLGIEHPVVNDFEMKVWQHYAVRAWPSFALINPAGRLVGQTSGEGIYDRAKPIIEQLIEVFSKENMLSPAKYGFETEAQKYFQQPLNFPSGIHYSSSDKKLYIVDTNNHRIISTNEDGQVVDIVGSGRKGFVDGTLSDAEFNQPRGIIAHNGLLYLADTDNHAIRVIDIKKNSVKTVCGNGKQAKKFNISGKFSDISLNSPWDVKVVNNNLWVAMAGAHQVWELDLQDEFAKPVLGHSAESLRDGLATEAMLAQPSAMAVDSNGCFIADAESSAIRWVENLQEKQVKTLVGKGLFDFGDEDGDLDKALLQHPLGIAKNEHLIYISDTYNHKIKVLDLANRKIQPLIGEAGSGLKDGSFSEAQLNQPTALSIANDLLYIADTSNHLIRVADLKTGLLQTLVLKNVPPACIESDLERKPIRISQPSISLSIELPERFTVSENMPSFVVIHQEALRHEVALDVTDKGVQSIDVSPLVSLDKPIGIDVILYFCTRDTDNAAACFMHTEYASLHFDPTCDNEQFTIEIIDRSDPLFF